MEYALKFAIFLEYKNTQVDHLEIYFLVSNK